MGVFENFGSKLTRAGNSAVKVIDLEPQQDPIPPGLDVCVTQVWMFVVFDIPGVQLQNQLSFKE